MQIKIKRQVDVEETVEVEFPVYFRWGDEADDGRVQWETFGRINADGAKLKVTCTTTREKIEYEVERERIGIERNLSQYLGEDRWGISRSATAEQFNRALAEAQADIAKWAAET